jgi:four helix bundle protein
VAEEHGPCRSCLPAYGRLSRSRTIWTDQPDPALSASIPANIAEGYGRESAGAYAQQLKIAQGSLKEFETHVELVHRIGMIDECTLSNVLKNSEEVGKMLRSLIRAIER